MDEPKIVEVHWVDSVGSSHWSTLDEKLEEFKPESIHHRSVGYIMRDDENGLVIAASRALAWHGSVADATFIPRVAVLKVSELK